MSFNPRAPRGARLGLNLFTFFHGCFNPRAPRGARRRCSGGIEPSLQFQSTRPAWGATCALLQPSLPPVVSIHAPRVGRDLLEKLGFKCGDVSIHAPRVGRDRTQSCVLSHGLQFQSTRPAWGATFVRRRGFVDTWSFNPRAPRGARPILALAGIVAPSVSIHAPRVGRDPKQLRAMCRVLRVSIHAPRVGRDLDAYIDKAYPEVSIHAPRVGRDSEQATGPAARCSFNPRAPRGARPHLIFCSGNWEIVSIHAPRVGRDSKSRTN